MCWMAVVFFFFKQKTAYEMRISDWSSDVCSSDLPMVPLDYSDPDGRMIELSVARAPATGDRIGALFVNPGGPGASGTDFASVLAMILPSEINEIGRASCRERVCPYV